MYAHAPYFSCNHASSGVYLYTFIPVEPVQIGWQKLPKSSYISIFLSNYPNLKRHSRHDCQAPSSRHPHLAVFWFGVLGWPVGSTWISIYLSIDRSIYLSICLSIYLSVYLCSSNAGRRKFRRREVKEKREPLGTKPGHLVVTAADCVCVISWNAFSLTFLSLDILARWCHFLLIRFALVISESWQPFLLTALKLQGLGIYLDARRKLKQEHKHKQRVFASSFSPVPWRQWRMMIACIGKARNQSKTNESTGNKREHNAVVQQTCLQRTPLEPYGWKGLRKRWKRLRPGKRQAWTPLKTDGWGV